MNAPLKSVFGSDIESSDTIQQAIGALNTDMRALLTVVDGMVVGWINHVQTMGDEWLNRLDAMFPNVTITPKEK